MALGKEPKSPDSWHQLAIAYGRIGNKGQSALALAEEALLNSKPDIAIYHSGLAEQLFASGTREWLQAQDIKIFAKDLEKKLKKKKK
jgi:predicted Zn-dependent protease